MARDATSGQDGLKSSSVPAAGETDFFLSCDTPLDRRIHRPLARAVARLLKPLPISPNAVTVLSLAPAALAALFFSKGKPEFVVAGLGAFYLWALLDHVDGELARLKNQTSEWGRKLDDFCDLVASNLMLAGIFAGLLRHLPAMKSGPVLALFIAGLVLNAAAGEAVTRAKRDFRRKTLEKGRMDPRTVRGQKILDHMTGREPFYLLIGIVIGSFAAGGVWAAGTACVLIGGIALMAAGAFAARLRMRNRGQAITGK